MYAGLAKHSSRLEFDPWQGNHLLDLSGPEFIGGSAAFNVTYIWGAYSGAVGCLVPAMLRYLHPFAKHASFLPHRPFVTLLLCLLRLLCRSFSSRSWLRAPSWRLALTTVSISQVRNGLPALPAERMGVFGWPQAWVVGGKQP